MKIIKSFKKSACLMRSFYETSKNEVENKEVDFSACY